MSLRLVQKIHHFMLRVGHLYHLSPYTSPFDGTKKIRARALHCPSMCTDSRTRDAGVLGSPDFFSCAGTHELCIFFPLQLSLFVLHRACCRWGCGVLCSFLCTRLPACFVGLGLLLVDRGSSPCAGEASGHRCLCSACLPVLGAIRGPPARVGRSRRVWRICFWKDGSMDGLICWTGGYGPCFGASCCCSSPAAMCSILVFQWNPLSACTCIIRWTYHCYRFFCLSSYSMGECVSCTLVLCALCFVNLLICTLCSVLLSPARWLCFQSVCCGLCTTLSLGRS